MKKLGQGYRAAVERVDTPFLFKGGRQGFRKREKKVGRHLAAIDPFFPPSGSNNFVSPYYFYGAEKKKKHGEFIEPGHSLLQATQSPLEVRGGTTVQRKKKKKLPMECGPSISS